MYPYESFGTLDFMYLGNKITGFSILVNLTDSKTK